MMQIRPSREEARELAASGAYRTIPLSAELYADQRTPMETLRILQSVSAHVFLLESVEEHRSWGRYTFLGYDPELEIVCKDGKMKITAGTTMEFETSRPQDQINRLLEENKSPHFDYLPPLTGGLIGYFAYDSIKYCEPTLRLDAEDQENFNDIDLMLFRRIIAYDNLRQKIVLMVHVRTEDFETEYNRGCMELENMKNLLLRGTPAKSEPLQLCSEFRSLFQRDEYCEMVEKAKRYIHEGDIFQVVLSNRLEADVKGSLVDAYRVMRTINPSPYMFYFSGSDIEMAGASPETLVKLTDGVLYTYPLAGTRPRGRTPEEDAQNMTELLADEKELAEHNMLVDLGRNDLGKLSRFGSVEVEKYLHIEQYSHVMHLASTVRGQIRPDQTANDAIRAVLPAGTLSGAPKIRACQIINELENNKRGVYGGAIGYLNFTGDMDTCIAIRMVFRKNDKVFVRSGAGIVADSVPETEYQECINKAMAVMKSLSLAEGGLE